MIKTESMNQNTRKIGQEALFDLPEIEKVTAELLMTDNRSQEAKAILQEAGEAKRSGERTLVRVCSDARVSMTYFLGRRDIVSFSSITGSGEIPRHALRHRGVKRVLTGTHIPKCGGLDAVKSGLDGVEEHVKSYLERSVSTSEAFLLAYDRGELLAAQSEKPTLAVVVNHETGLVHPIAFWTDKGRASKSVIPQAYLRTDKFDRAKLSEDGSIPELAIEELPSELAELIEDNRRALSGLARDFAESQKVQNPHTVVISTVAVPSALRYPQTFGRPNTGFSIHAEYFKGEHGVTGFNEKQVEDVIGHAWYPIFSQKSGHGFSRLSTYLIEAPQMSMARRLAENLQKQPWFSEWQGQVLCAQVESGVTAAIEKFER